MQTLSRIVLPVDFSERSVGAARYAHSLANRFGCGLVLLHVVSPLQFEYGAMDIGGYMLAELYQNRVAQAQSLGFNPGIADRKRTGNVYWIDIDLKPTDSVLKASDLQGEAGRIVRLEVKGCPADAGAQP